MRLLSMAAAFTVAMTVAVPLARAADCDSLWEERNSYYKAYGYCFKTERAIRRFGNDGCYIYNESEMRLPPAIRDRIQQIVRLERDLRCAF
jgi:hypothetical protein